MIGNGREVKYTLLATSDEFVGDSGIGQESWLMLLVKGFPSG